MKHPALNMSKQREQVWLKEATADDYFAMIDLLKALYAKKVYNERQSSKKVIQYDPNVLMVDYANRAKEPVKVGDDGINTW